MFAVYVTGMVGITKAVPLGIALKVSPLYVFLMAILGAYTSAAVICLGHGWIEKLAARCARGDRMRRKRVKLSKLISRYGVAGMCLIGTVLVGSNLTFLLGLSVVDRKKVLVAWVAAGIALWAAALTVIGAVGFSFASGMHLPYWLTRWAGMLTTKGA